MLDAQLVEAEHLRSVTLKRRHDAAGFGTRRNNPSDHRAFFAHVFFFVPESEGHPLLDEKIVATAMDSEVLLGSSVALLEVLPHGIHEHHRNPVDRDAQLVRDLAV